MSKYRSLLKIILLPVLLINFVCINTGMAAPVYIAPHHAFKVNISVSQAQGKNVDMKVARSGFYQDESQSYPWVDFMTPESVIRANKYSSWISLEWIGPPTHYKKKVHIEDNTFYQVYANKELTTYLAGKTKKGLQQKYLIVQFYNRKKITINGRAAYQLSARIKIPYDNTIISGFYTYINFRHHVGFVGCITKMTLESRSADFLNECNQAIDSLSG